ncbi:NOP5/NOP56 family protein [Methanocella arvoryzae]|uniref:Nop56-like pre-mRNA processing protein n=1 Tax=Methanocella arvoryzae (strain DSM 22066 / NBRC 105507 / MRE50) TaxID=351160 RepID=Q0W8E5_METAR|nr:NOP5/NOP56 family protein [Methanocella arvoryzae]CAJ35348.1 Nop56-like pre-mRNA processing protein [Methanocella arvoryzae MRE50]
MNVWFGEEAGDGWKIAGTTPEELAAYASRAESTRPTGSPDFERIAIDAGLCSSPAEYLRLMHDTAMLVARSRIQALLSARDADIVQSIKALDTIHDAYNEVSERLTEWYGIHYPDRKARPQEIITSILSLAPGEVPPGAPLTAGDIAAMQGFAKVAQALFDERKSLEQYIMACMDEVAPNLSDVLGPLLGARLIARAGGLERLAKLPAGSIQVMGAGEALFKHIREGTPSPKHGFIYRHPMISGAPKRLRGKMSRMIAGRATIAARVDAYSGERLDLGSDVRARATRLRGGQRRPKA